MSDMKMINFSNRIDEMISNDEILKNEIKWWNDKKEKYQKWKWNPAIIDKDLGQKQEVREYQLHHSKYWTVRLSKRH